MSLVVGFLTVVGLPMAMGVFFRGFFRKSNPNVPALMAATVMFGLQQVLVYRGDARISTVLPRLLSYVPETLRDETWVMLCVMAVLTFAGIVIPFVFARLGIRISDFVEKVAQKVSDFFGRILGRKKG